MIMKNKKAVIIISAIVALLVILGVVLWYVNIQLPHNIAVKNYNAAIAIIEGKNNELDQAITKLQTLIDSGEKTLDDTIVDTSKEVLKTAGTSKIIIDEMPKKTEDIIIKTKELRQPVDYTDILQQLNDTYTAFDTSIKQYKQFITPTEDFVIQRLQTIDEVKDVRPVTEDNDPNGKLNKPGGYTATVYFESSNVNQSKVYGINLIDKGTEAGGAVEVYSSEEDAIKRNDYLALYDGGILASGSHKVIGTVIIRTSDELTASKQKALEEKVINALAALQ